MKRIVRVSKSAREQFRIMLIQGAEKFGIAVSEAKRDVVVDKIENYLAENPHRGRRDPRRKFWHYPVSKTPFVVVYEYDDAELRVLFIVHNRADRRRLRVADVEW